jgi:hypothetical protein
MTTIDDHKVESDSLRVQLGELNQRARWYSSQIWQVPFAFFGIAALVIGATIDKNNFVTGLAFLIVFGLGVTVLIHLQGLADGERRAVLNIQKIEEQLYLEQTAQYKPRVVWSSIQVFTIVVTVACLLSGIFFLTR